MPQIKITVSEEELRQLQELAAGSGLSLSAQARQILFPRGRKVREPPLSGAVDRSRRRKISLVLPEELLAAVDAEAAAEQMNRSEYLTDLLVQKGTPLHITYSDEPTVVITEQLSSLMNDVRLLADMVRRSGGALYDSEIAAIVASLKKVNEELQKALQNASGQTRRSVRQVRDEILRRKTDSQTKRSRGSPGQT